jgi:DNA replication ATP-dependent helicase Dna2
LLLFSAKVLFLNTDRLPALETSDGERIQNPREADVVQLVVEALCQSGVAEAAVGVLSVYRAQLRLLTARLRSRAGVEVLTADRSQGRDKDCIIISLVRSNAHAAVGDLLRDWRRLNVSFTRAKSKLVIVGSRNTLEGVGVLRAFLDLVDERGWAYELPPGAENIYRGLAPAARGVPPQGINTGLQSSSPQPRGAKRPALHRVGALPRVTTRKLGVAHDLFAELSHSQQQQNQQPQQQQK